MKEVLVELFKWLERNLPGWIAAYTIGYNKGQEKTQEKEIELSEVKLELEKKKNEEIIEQINRDLDDSTIIRRAIIKGRNFLSGKR